MNPIDVLEPSAEFFFTAEMYNTLTPYVVHVKEPFRYFVEAENTDDNKAFWFEAEPGWYSPDDPTIRYGTKEEAAQVIRQAHTDYMNYLTEVWGVGRGDVPIDGTLDLCGG